MSLCAYLHQGAGRKTKWCRNAGRDRKLQDWGMGHFVEEKKSFKKGDAFSLNVTIKYTLA